MSESLKQRVGRLVAGGFNALVDAVENAAPETVMEQAIREIDTATAEVRKELGVVEAQRHLTAKRLADDNKRHDDLTEQARLAMKEGRDDLAETAVSRQIDLEAQIPVLETRLADLADEKARLEGYINALKAKKREMRDALDSFRQSQRQASQVSGQGDSGGSAGADNRAERASAAFDRVFSRQTGLAGASGASTGEEAKLAELEELSRKNRIQERLARLKSDDS
ncbi:MAG: PspA/IM30 family protein [Wenzhouxiangella sp.]|nr:MAG: PspA/IM30 family protein [Wenzhouxiangella sp.]